MNEICQLEESEKVAPIRKLNWNSTWSQALELSTQSFICSNTFLLMTRGGEERNNHFISEHIFTNAIFVASLKETKDFHRPRLPPTPSSFARLTLENLLAKKTFQTTAIKTKWYWQRKTMRKQKGKKTFLWIFIHRIRFHLSCLSWERYFEACMTSSGEFMTLIDI